VTILKDGERLICYELHMTIPTTGISEIRLWLVGQLNCFAGNSRYKFLL
jgi:hypothetical protein